MSLANRLVALVLGGVALAFTARSLIRVLWIVHRLIWGVRPSRSPSLWAVLILVGLVTVLFGLARPRGLAGVAVDRVAVSWLSS